MKQNLAQSLSFFLISSLSARFAFILPVALANKSNPSTLMHMTQPSDHDVTPASAIGTGLIFGRVLDGKGGGREISWEDAQNWHPARSGEVLWLHLDRTVKGISDWLKHEMKLPEATTELLISNETRPRAFLEEGALVATLRGVNFNPGAKPEDMIAIQVWADETSRHHLAKTTTADTT